MEPEASLPEARNSPEPLAPDSADALHMSFDEPEWEELQTELPLETADEPFSLGTPDEVPAAHTGALEETPAEETTEPEAEPTEPPLEITPAGASDEAEVPRQTSLSSFLVFVVVIIGLYFVLGAALVGNRALADRVVSRLPLIGPVLRVDTHARQKVLLAETAASFDRLRTGEEVFVVRGRAFNGASEPLRRAQIEVQLFDAGGSLVARESTVWGGAISQRIVGEIDRRTLDTLRRAQPADSFTVPPGESAPFTVVFLRPPDAAREYAARVVTAESD